jgi:signal transduction histidine kinase
VTQGDGLGLAVCRQIIEAQGGHITVESAGIDRGSAFTVTLPSVPLVIPATAAKAATG